MPEFLAENNLCGQTILHLVSRGNAIIAETLRLKDYIPKLFRLDNKQDAQKYNDIIMDFNYFKISDMQEAKIENNEVLQDLDAEFRDNHIEIINRFYQTFENIHIYITDLNHFIEEINDGFYIHQNLESIFSDLEGKQLMCEALYLYGLMLLLIDTHIEGIIRERLLVSYYRYNSQRSDTQSRIDEICKLLRDTMRKTPNYPEDYFRRIPINSVYIDMVLSHLRSDDIYNQLQVYPLSKHRSIALTTQAALLYICLYFSADILHTQTSCMREIVDKYFPDNWVIPIHMGFTVNLIESWDNFKAAKLALNNTLETGNLKHLAQSYAGNVPKLLKQTNQLLKEDITNDVILKNIHQYINYLKDWNITIRWLMLHVIKPEQHKRAKQMKDLILNEAHLEQIQLFKLLLNTAQFELILKDLFKKLLNAKMDDWHKYRDEIHKNLVELSEIFNGEQLKSIPKNRKLHDWFAQLSQQILELKQDQLESTRKIVQFMQALQEVQEFHQLDRHMHVMQYLNETCKLLDQLLCMSDLKDDILIHLQIISDLSYGWELIDLFTPIMQMGLKKESHLVIKLRAIFLKLASAIEYPLIRINQAHSNDFISVTQYYSRELEIYVRKVIQIIPKMMFDMLIRIIGMQTNVLLPIPTRLDKDKLKDYAQLQERFEFAELTHSISIFSQGMRKMKNTLVGVISLDPKKLLEDGIRIELVKHISKALHEELIFAQKLKPDEFEAKLKNLNTIVDGYRKSFEYIQDYININGLKVWQEEMTRLINYNVEQECNGFLRAKVHTWESAYQSRYVPIPIYPSTDSISINFIGRLAREMIRLTDPRQTIFLENTSMWYDPKNRKISFRKELFELMISALEITGLVGIDRLFAFMIVTNLQKISGFLENKNIKSNLWYNIILNVHIDLKNIDENLQNPPKFYQNCVNRTTKIWPEFLNSILLVGQLQLLRNLIAFHLNKSCKFNAKTLELALRNLNGAILLDIKDSKYMPDEELMLVLSRYFDYAGLNKPYNKIYIASKFQDDFAITLFVFVIAHLTKLHLSKQNGTPQNFIDGTTLAVALHTIIKQYHVELNRQFLRLLSEYIGHLNRYQISLKNSDLLSEAICATNFLEIYTNLSKNSYDLLKECVPTELLHLQKILAVN